MTQDITQALREAVNSMLQFIDDDTASERPREWKRLVDKLRDALAQPEQPSVVPQKLWLWKNFVNGKPEYLVFDNPYPIHMDCGDPQTIGEPCGYALFKPSRCGRVQWTEESVISRIPDEPMPSEVNAAYVRGRNDGWDAAMLRQKASPAAPEAAPQQQARNPPSSIQIGAYEIRTRTDDTFWIEHESGEGMQCQPNLLADWIAKFYKENF